MKTKPGAHHAFSFDIGFGDYRRGRNLLLGYRQVRARPPIGKSAEVARGAYLPGSYPAANSAFDLLAILMTPHGRARA
jgi:hypothetical protein